MVRLGNCFTIIRNGASIKQIDGASGLPITRIETISKCEINRDKFGYANICDEEKYKDYFLHDDDILMSHINSEKHLGKCAIYHKEKGEKIIHGMNLLMLRANKTVISPQYAVYYFETPFFKQQIVNITKKSVNQASFTVTALKEIEIPLLSYEKQNKIVKILDKLNEIINKRQQQLKKLDELVKSRFIEMFGDTVLNPYNWKKDLLGMVCDVRDGTHDSPQYYEIGYPLVTSKNVTAGIIDLSDCSLISEEDYNKINERSKVDIGDIIMPMIGTVGKPVIVNVEPNFAIKNVSLIKFKKESKVLNIYIRAFLQSDYFDDAVLSKLRGGTQKFISLGDIRNLEVLMPPIELQNEFADFVKQTDKSKLEIQKSLDKLEILKKSLMQQYFE